MQSSTKVHMGEGQRGVTTPNAANSDTPHTYTDTPDTSTAASVKGECADVNEGQEERGNRHDGSQTHS
eukprot:m.366733 g.366733  ORF g.366733 m.366733 type:complete len:68 (-) comp37305_c0_seq1:144-347(-)